jgi:thioredoxin-related protein
VNIRALFAVCAMLTGIGAIAAPAPPRGSLPAASHLAADAREAGLPGVVFVLLFSLPDCHYCAEVRQQYLAPLQRDEANRGRLVIRELQLDSTRALTDFAGKQTTVARFAARYKVNFAPTVLFLDGQGRQVAAPLLGAGKADFYGAYLDDAIAAARKAATPTPDTAR